MNQKHFFIAVALVFGLSLSGCARNRGSASRSVPVGPVYTGAAAGVIPAGTELVLRTNELISTERAVTDRTYSAQIAREIVDANGRTVVPQGAPAELIVTRTETGGTTGTPELEMALRSITVDGRRYSVTADRSQVEAEAAGIGANRRTAEMVGGGALIGAVIGAIAGGGTGAAIGAAAGAGGGAAVQVITRGDRVQVPAESLLTFRTDRAIRLEGYRR